MSKKYIGGESSMMIVGLFILVTVGLLVAGPYFVMGIGKEEVEGMGAGGSTCGSTGRNTREKPTRQAFSASPFEGFCVGDGGIDLDPGRKNSSRKWSDNIVSVDPVVRDEDLNEETCLEKGGEYFASGAAYTKAIKGRVEKELAHLNCLERPGIDSRGLNTPYSCQEWESPSYDGEGFWEHVHDGRGVSLEDNDDKNEPLRIATEGTEKLSDRKFPHGKQGRLDLMVKSGVTVGECYEKCATTGGCASFAYNTQYQKCQLSTSIAVPSDTEYSEGDDYYKMKSPTSCLGKAPSMGCALSGVEGTGPRMVRGDGVTEKEAVGKCRDADGCVAINWQDWGTHRTATSIGVITDGPFYQQLAAADETRSSTTGRVVHHTGGLELNDTINTRNNNNFLHKHYKMEEW